MPNKTIRSDQKTLDEWMYEKWEQERTHEPCEYINKLTKKIIQDMEDDKENNDD